MFEKHGDKPLHAAKDRVVNHHRPHMLVVEPDEASIETIRQDEIKLNRSALPASSTTIDEMEFQLGTVESAFARTHIERQVSRRRSLCKRCFRAIPDRVVACSLLGTRGQQNVEVREPKVGID